MARGHKRKKSATPHIFIMDDYSKEDLLFVEVPPQAIAIECPICLQIMNKETSLTSCGHHFCTSCIERVKEGHGSCPKCRCSSFQTFPDADRLRFINGLTIYCTNKKEGCAWKGELKHLSKHINIMGRHGECQFQLATCCHQRCNISMKRVDLSNHEKNACLERHYCCEYCNLPSTYKEITSSHYDVCPWYPVPCPNKCDLQKITTTREYVDHHLKNDCPLQAVECEFSWAGCTVRPLRSNAKEHINDDLAKHLTLLAKDCKESKKQNKQLKEENQELKENISELRKTLYRNGIK
ncbi:PREDICTED: TNF receptor-associated factor 4-like [Amphimedon queenslandica]|uniref:RING-type domain-containing protein n=2 Tax=Amphimedon queenslandica TaxID=400682 RepID=A0AAN0ILH2_AMPQE|nr:PREDICTED: TNF receptor-associated factor 4-like [Amphimedon queenslandica]|eukprot:XP_011403293.1 PREDICTED: TNF receptor-associated factor 4-like [Amphimedon queenslandica]